MKKFSFFSFAVVDRERSGKISLAARLERERVGGETWGFLSEPHWHHYTDTVDAFIAVKKRRKKEKEKKKKKIVMSVKATTNKNQLSGKMKF